MVREHGGDGEIVVPPTIHALLQARIDSLDGDVRVVMERGAVEGEVFHRGAVTELSPEQVGSEVESHLATLVRKELIRSTSPTFPQDEGYRFRHLLIRDAAYESLPKATRAELHEQFAGWLSTHDLVEGDEIVGYHLEQAHRYRSELDGSDPALPELARRASDHLATAGGAALDRGDYNAGRSLFRRATGLLPSGDEQRLALAPDYADALFEAGDGDEAWDLLSDALSTSDPLTRAYVLVTRAHWGVVGRADQREREAWRDEALETFEESQDHNGIARYWWSVAIDVWFRLLATETADALVRALEHLERAGLRHGRIGEPIRARLIAAYAASRIPVDEAIPLVRDVGAARETGALASAWERVVLGRLHAMRGEFELARELVRGGRQAYVDAGLLMSAGGISMSEAEIEGRAGDQAAAERALREGLEILEEIGERGYYPTAALMLADVLYERGAYDEVREWTEKARATTGSDDLVNFVYLDSIEGALLAREGRFDEAEARARNAVDLTATIDHGETRAVALRYLAEVLALAGRAQEAECVAADALEIRDEKGDMTGAARMRELFARLGLEVA
jgi:tetratricopeptide (TPR) repeat protein